MVFNGALKSNCGLTAKSSIVEDGLMVQVRISRSRACVEQVTGCCRAGRTLVWCRSRAGVEQVTGYFF